MVYDSLKDVFIDDIKKYLKDNMNILLEDYSELNTLKVENAYAFEHKPTPPEIDVVCIDYRDDTVSDSYDEGENLSFVGLQFYCYGKSMKIKDSENKYDPIKVTTILADFITKLLKRNVIGTKNKNIISSRKLTQTNVMQVRDFSMYYCVLRYDFRITNDYKKVYKD